MASRLDRLENALDTFGRTLMAWWVWPSALVVFGLIALTAGWVCYPVGNDVHAFGRDLMGPCEFRELHGQPCASCGMTRSWVWAARGYLPTALRYNIAGTVLYLGLVAGGLVGALRLLLRKKGFLRFHWAATGSIATGWILLYAFTWGLRIAGFYPLD